MTRTTFSRRRFAARSGLIATVGAALPLRYAQAAAEFTFKWGTNVPETHPLNVYARKASEEIKEAPQAERIDLQIFANNQLGGDSDMFSQLSVGRVGMFLPLGRERPLDARSPRPRCMGLGFAFKDYSTLWKALDGKVGEHLRGPDRRRPASS